MNVQTVQTAAKRRYGSRPLCLPEHGGMPGQWNRATCVAQVTSLLSEHGDKDLKDIHKAATAAQASAENSSGDNDLQ
jgi:hypothetical protein